MKIKLILLIISIFISACAGNNESVVDNPGIVETPLPTVEDTPIPTIDESASDDGNSDESVQITEEPESSQPAAQATVEQFEQDIQPTAEPYPPPVITAEPPPGYPIQPSREAKIQSEPYPSEENNLVSLPTYGYEVVNEYDHDPQAFTQGLVVTNNGQEFIEGTGLWGESSLRRVDINTGEVSQFHELPGEVFGEGLTEFDDQIYQLTWKSMKGYIYDSLTFEQVGEFEYPHEGWGITHDGQEFIVSDGTSTVYFWDPATMEQTRTIQVSDPNGPLARLNELEYFNGEILANIWQTDRIARISPTDGQVLGWIDLTGLFDTGPGGDPDDVLNGIAYDAQSDKLYVTGKRWPLIFEIELIEN